MRLRGLAKARVGPRNERITEFGVAPVRRRGGRKKKEVEPAEPPEGPSPPPVVTNPGSTSNTP